MNLQPEPVRQPLLSEFSLDDVQRLADENPNLRGYIQGYLAESRLAKQLSLIKGVSNVVKIPDTDDLRGDLLVTYQDVDLTIECKSLSSGILRQDALNGSWEASVLCKNTDRRTTAVRGRESIQSVNLHKGGFDVLSICTFPVTGRWDSLFLLNRYLPERDGMPGLIKSRFIINTGTTPGLTDSAERILNEAFSAKIMQYTMAQQ